MSWAKVNEAKKEGLGAMGGGVKTAKLPGGTGGMAGAIERRIAKGGK